MDGKARQLPPLEPLKGFEAAARHLSFTRAAEELCLTQSAISRQIQALEAHLGVALFVRLPRRLQLTEEGETLLRTLRVVFGQLEAVAESMSPDRRRPVTLSTTIGVAALWLVPRLSGFMAEHPEVDVRVSANNRVVDMAREGIDLALRFSPPEMAPPDSHRLFGELIFPMGAPEVAGDLAQKAATRDDISRLTLLNYEDPTKDVWMGWDIWLNTLGLEGAKPKAVLHFNHYDQVIAAALAGQGVALGREMLVRQHLESGRLVGLLTPYRHVADRAYYLVEAPGSQRPEARLLRDWLLAQATG
ncbi:MAG: LysR family transcriptional regulator [Rhodocyclaceae bacterium]|nr:MAG: LysR family transcriptional regulator [Rhodocyclaceae bacterium]